MGGSLILLCSLMNNLHLGPFRSMSISHDIFFYYHGLGDSLLFNSVVYELGRQTGKRYLIGTKHREIYEGNPYALILPFPQYANYKIFRFISPVLGLNIHHLDYYYEGSPPKQHILTLLGKRVGLETPLARPSIFLNKREKETRLLPESEKPWLGIQSTGLALWTDNKNWGVDSFAEVANLLKDKFSIVQLGQGGDPNLPVDLHLQGKLSIREVFVALRQCNLFIGQEGFLMHAATAVNLPAVVVYGGFLAPEQTGYAVNENIYSAVECAPCWLETKCPYDKKCLTMIKPEIVAQKAISKCK